MVGRTLSYHGTGRRLEVSTVVVLLLTGVLLVGMLEDDVTVTLPADPTGGTVEWVLI
jgi:hypothetical protein